MKHKFVRSRFILFILTFLGFILQSEPALAYIGPGAGFAVISSFLLFLITGVLAFFTILFWPFRAALLYFRRRLTRRNKKVRRVIVLGLDGLDPKLTRQYMNEGRMPNFLKLTEAGSYRALATTKPSISPVAWSSFSTGVNPGKHRIFDFYTRDPGSYMPALSSVDISSVNKPIKLGPLKIPRNKTDVRFLRKATSFWTILGKHGIFSNILRVPISFPPEKFYGAGLSAMCAPDLRGTQGAFTCFCTNPEKSGEQFSEGVYVPIEKSDNSFQALIEGPPLSGNKTPAVKMTGDIDTKNGQVHICIDKTRYTLKKNVYSPWIKLNFKAGLKKKATGIARFLLIDIEPDFRLYMSPINIDPEKPALPVSYPLYYSAVLSKLYGSFSTLGLSEDTWALNEGVIDEQHFLDQAYDIYEERKKHFFDALKKNKEGLVVCVFDTTDRIQHMFFRYLDSEHPANEGKDVTIHETAVQDLYSRMDEMVGDVFQKIGRDDLLMIISDHGFTQFKWGVNLNTWLWQNGYLVLKPGAVPGKEDWLKNVDWSKSQAYALGLTGIFVNLKGRESRGIVKNGNERLKLQLELKEKLESFVDEGNGQKPVRRAMLSQMNLEGPYVDDAPDLIVGYAEGYRSSWNCAVGKVTEDVIEPNTRHWSGDHSVDPELVPGVFFSNWKLEEKDPSIMDIGPTIQNLFGIPREKNQDGRILSFMEGGA